MKKTGMKPAKVGALFLVAVMAMAAVGASYAHWQDILVIKGDITMDDMDVRFVNYETSDPFDTDGQEGRDQHLDPSDCSYDGVLRNKDIGYTKLSTPNPQTLNIEIGDAYPCYYSHIKWQLENHGSVPALLQHRGYLLQELSADGTIIDIEDIELRIGHSYSVLYTWVEGDPDGYYEVTIDVDVDPCDLYLYDFTLTPTGDDLLINTQLDPIAWDTLEKQQLHMESYGDYLGVINSDLCIHFENGCMEDATYDFKICTTWYNWPHFVTDIPTTDITTWPEDGTAYIGYEDLTSGDYDYNDFGMDMFIQETHEVASGKLLEIYMEFEVVNKISGHVHDIHIERILAAPHDYDYTITRTRTAQGTEKAAGTYSSGGSLDVIIFDTKYVSPGDKVTIHLVSTEDPQAYGPGTAPRWDLDSIWGHYDPYMKDRNDNVFRHIEDWQNADPPLPGPNNYNVPFILVVPETGWSPPGEGVVITNPYPLFDEYYKTQNPIYEDWYT